MISSTEAEKKIKNIKAIGDIINALKAYAGLTVRKTEELALNMRRYEDVLIEAMANITHHHPKAVPIQQEDGKRIVVAFGSSQGLCGPYNDIMAKGVFEATKPGDALVIIGRKLKDALVSTGIPYLRFRDSIVSTTGIQSALQETLADISEEYGKAGYYALVFVFATLSGQTANIAVERILPPDWSRMEAVRPAETAPLMYLDPGKAFEKVLEEFLYISLYRSYVDSLRSENWYRLKSLEAASENIERRLSELSALQNYARQEEITEEMREIFGGGMFYK